MTERDYWRSRYHERDGWWYEIVDLVAGTGRIIHTDGIFVDQSWDYTLLGQAVVALESWDPGTQREPEGWIRHVPSYRRRPGGNPAYEYVGY